MKSKLLSLIISSALILTSCHITGDDYENPNTKAKNTQNEIMRYFTDKDFDKLKEIFCPYVQENYYNLDEEIEEAFNFIDGEIVSYNDPFPTVVGAKSDESGWVLKEYSAETKNVLTDKGTEYTITFRGWLINRENEDKTGVIHIYIVNQTILSELKENNVRYSSDDFSREIGDFSDWT